MSYFYSVRKVSFGILPAVEVEFSPKIKTLTSMAALPEGFKSPNLNLLPIQFLRQYGCVLDFRE